MGLESHVDLVLREAGVKRDLYYWRNGLNIVGSILTMQEIASKIMKVLDESEQFGPTRYNRKVGKIEFGVFCDFFSGEKNEYNQYREDFKNWKVDATGKKIEEI